jgi:hypothetical protein
MPLSREPSGSDKAEAIRIVTTDGEKFFNSGSKVSGFAAVGAGGGWEEVAGSPFTPTVANTLNITWDETLYSHIRIIIDDIRTNDDNSLFGLRMGSGNGASIHSSAGNYQNQSMSYTVSGWTADGGDNHIPVAAQWGAGATEGLFGEINILGGYNNGTTHSLIDIEAVYNLNTGTQVGIAIKTMVRVDSALDTIQFRMTTVSEDFQAVGNIRVYGQFI